MPRTRRKYLKLPHPIDPLALSVDPLGHQPSDPAEFATTRLGLLPDPIQAAILREDPHRCIINCCRQWGKSTITAAKAVHTAVTKPGSLTLVLSPSGHQSGEFIKKASNFLQLLRIPTHGDGYNDIALMLPNQARIVGLPAKAHTLRGFSSVSFLIVDEASMVPEDLYRSVRPSLAVSNGQIWLISTPRGRQGFFYNAWISPDNRWKRVQVPAFDCPRISPEFLAEERLTLPDLEFRQDYLCEFTDTVDTVFPAHLLKAALANIPPLPIGRDYSSLFIPDLDYTHYSGSVWFFIGVDLGQVNDYTAISIIERANIVSGPRNMVDYSYPTVTRYCIRYLERLPLGTTYPNVVEHLCTMLRHPALGINKVLIVDGTNVGRPVVDMIQMARPRATFVPVTFTSGGQPSTDGTYYRVPRRDLITSLEISFQNERLKISNQIQESEILLQELGNLRRNLKDDGDNTIQPGRKTIHDDLVFATALANWRATERI